MVERGRLISLEGGEGAGKSTLADKLDESFTRRGFKFLRRREPGGTSLGEAVRAVVLDPGHGDVSPIAETFLMQAARAQLVYETIEPALEEGKIVLLDRFYDSSIAYQGVARNLGFEFIHKLSLTATQGLEPDLTLILDIDPLMGRSRQSHTPDRMEQEVAEFHYKVREGFQRIVREFDRAYLIDASQTPEKVYEEATKLIHSKLGIILP